MRKAQSTRAWTLTHPPDHVTTRSTPTPSPLSTRPCTTECKSPRTTPNLFQTILPLPRPSCKVHMLVPHFMLPQRLPRCQFPSFFPDRFQPRLGQALPLLPPRTVLTLPTLLALLILLLAFLFSFHNAMNSHLWTCFSRPIKRREPGSPVILAQAISIVP